MLILQGKSEKELAKALHQMRRDLGIKYKDMTPQPLRDYIFDINIGRYGDPLGPSYEWMQMNEMTCREIIESASRYNPDINKLLAGFKNWLRGQ